MTTTKNTVPRRSDRDQARAITKAIRDAERELRARLPFLRHQTAIGMAFLLLAYGTFAASAVLYVRGVLPAWITIPTAAIAVSILREIEHDLIHDLYFKGRRWLQNVILFTIWPALGNIPSPLFRREMHLHHHRRSGQDDDFEERLIGNGMRYGALRWLAMIDAGLSTLFRRRELHAMPLGREMGKHLFPVCAAYYAVWVTFLLYHGAACFGFAGPAWLLEAMAVVDTLAVIWVLPNVLRQASLQVLSSTLHYHGDVENVLQQTQVLSRWRWLPLQIFTWNFGATHALHHFVVNQPFYVRELVRRDAHAAMRRHGVRFDDMGTLPRANRYAA